MQQQQEHTNGHARANGRTRTTLVHNLAAEASVLGGVILRNDTLAQLDDLEVNDFYDFKHQVVWGAIRTLQASGTPVDVVTIETEIEKVGKLDAIGGVGFIGELALRVPTADNVVHYAREVARDAKIRRGTLLVADLLERIQRGTYEPEELLSEAAGELQRLDIARIEAIAPKTRWAVPLGHFLGEHEPDDDDSVDWIIRDVIPRAEAALLGGQMKGGKTWSALDLLICVALGQPWLGSFENTLGPAPALGILLEDSTRRLRKRLWELCRGRGISPNDDVLRANLRLSRATFRLPDPADERRLIAEINAMGAKVVVVDNLTRVMVGDPNKTTDAANFTRAWMRIVEATGATVIFLHHTKKPSGDQRNVDAFDTLRGSGDFGAAARNMLVTTPLRTDSEDKVSEVRIRGNLDLARESFTLGFERRHLLGRWQARLVDRGDVEQLKDETRKVAKETRDEKKKQEFEAKLEHRKRLAMAIVAREGSVSQKRLAKELGLESERTLANVFDDLVRDKQLIRHPKRGYELPNVDRQESLV